MYLLSAFLSSFMYFSRRRSIHSLHARAVSETGFPGVSLPNSSLRTLAIGSNSLCLIAWREATSVASSRSCFCSGHRKGRACRSGEPNKPEREGERHEFRTSCYQHSRRTRSNMEIQEQRANCLYERILTPSFT